MPIDHGRRLAPLLSDAELVEVDDAYTLLSFDRPDVLSSALTRFLERTTAAT